MSLRRGGRVAEGARLESGYTERYRGFESLPHRHTKTAPSGRFFYGAEVRVRSLVGFDRSSGTIGTAAGAPQGQGTWMCPGISLPHRHTKTAPSGRFFYGAEVRVRSLVGFGRSSGTIGPSFQALTALHDSALPNAQSVFKLACFSGPGGELNNFSNQPLDDRE